MRQEPLVDVVLSQNVHQHARIPPCVPSMRNGCGIARIVADSDSRGSSFPEIISGSVKNRQIDHLRGNKIFLLFRNTYSTYSTYSKSILSDIIRIVA